MQTLERVPLTIENESNELDKEHAALLQLARRELNYSITAKQTSDVELKKVLKELCIEPFSMASIDKYKYETAGYYDNLNVICGIAAGISFIAGFFSGVFSALEYFAPKFGGNFLAINSSIFGACIAVALIVAIVVVRNRLDMKRIWVRSPLSEFKQPIPEFALQTALDIKAKCPNTLFFVDELKIEKRTEDPFLVVSADQSSPIYYIEVWNEPKFNQVREI